MLLIKHCLLKAQVSLTKHVSGALLCFACAHPSAKGAAQEGGQEIWGWAGPLQAFLAEKQVCCRQRYYTSTGLPHLRHLFHSAVCDQCKVKA